MITLTSPTTGSQHFILTHTITRQTAGGKIVHVRPSTWAPADTFHWKFVNITKTVKDELTTFLDENAGKQLQIRDEVDRTWLGVITNPIIEFRQTHPNNAPESCPDNSLYSFSIEFEGSRIA